MPEPTPPQKPDWLTATVASAATALLFSLIAWLAEPAAVVVKPEPTPPVVVKPVKAAPASWYIVNDATTLRIDNADLEKVAGTLPLGKFTAKGVPQVGEPEVFRTITISDGSKPEPPKPDPEPEPEPPDVIPTLTGFAKIGYSASRPFPASDRVKVADNFDGAAARIAAGELKTVAAANASLKSENASDVSRDTWLPFFVAWAAEADAQNKSGKLRTVEDYAQAFRDTAEGLRK